MLSFFPLDVLDEIWDVTESVSEGFLTYSFINLKKTFDNYGMQPYGLPCGGTMSVQI